MTAISYPKTSMNPHRLCPTCGELLVSSRCPECAPAEPARSYSDRMTQPITGASGAIGLALAQAVDARRATGEWVTGPDDRDPQTRRAHPTLVRTALAEAEERARDNVARSALVTRVETTTKPRYASTSTSPRLRQVTPLPPPPSAAPETSEASEASAADVPVEAVLASAIALPATVPDKVTQRVVVPSQIVYDPASFLVVAAPEIQPATEFEFEPDPPDRRATVFWLTLLACAVVLLLSAAI